MRKLSSGQLKGILAAHEKWLESGGKEGEIADFRGADLRKAKLQGTNLQGAILLGANLQGANLWRTNLQDAILRSANLQGANLQGANLQGANLQRANLQGTVLVQADLQNANLQDTKLREANLREADLTSAENLSAKQLAGSKISGAILPESTKIEGLERVTEASQSAKRLFQLMLLGCFYTWLIIATTKDVNLLTNSAFFPLPIISIAIQISWFYWAAPVFLLGFYVYFHIYLQRLWEELALQPAVFPDGKRLDEKTPPWILNGLVYLHFKRLRDDCPHLLGLKNFISILLAWGIVPITIGLFWGRYLVRHDWLMTTIHIIVLSLSIWAGIRFYLLAAATFRGEKRFSWEEALTHGRNAKSGLAAFAILVFLIALYSCGAVNSNYPDSLDFLFSCTVANFVGAEVSTKPANWKGKNENVRGADLRGRNLQRARVSRAFLVKADLREADLTLADLWDANLQEANLEGANLRRANLQKANLEGANLQRANLQRVNLGEANLQGAALWKANLQGANLWLANLKGASLVWADLRNVKLQGAFLGEANLSGANFQGADLQEAYLEGVDLRNVVGLTKKQVESAHVDDKTKLPDYLQKKQQ
jgi:uncharacterized protein YjbI with pentapeptide repeats